MSCGSSYRSIPPVVRRPSFSEGAPRASTTFLPAAWLALLAALSLLTAPAAAGWQRVGPEAGSVGDLERVAARPATVYAGGPAGGLSRSNDGGRSWSSLLPVLPAAAVAEVGVGPEGRVVVAVEAGDILWHSVDAGTTWGRGTVAAGGPRGDFQEVVVAAGDPSVVYAAGRGVLRSSDGGATWDAADAGRADADVEALAVHPTDPDLVYAATVDDGLYRSDDGGGSWRRVLEVASPVDLRDVALDPADPDTVYLAGSHGLRVSRDGGATWSGWRGPIALNLVEADPETPGRALVARVYHTGRRLGGFRYILYRVDGHGATWQPMADLRPLRAVLPAAGGEPLLIGQDELGVSRGVEEGAGGLAFQRSNRGLRTHAVTALALSPQAPSTVLVTRDDPVRLARSHDGGARFLDADRAELDLPVQRVVVHGLVPNPLRPGDAYVLATDSVILSVDRAPGALYSPASRPLAGGRPFALAVHPRRPRRLFVLTRGGFGVPEGDRLFVSPDHGETWEERAGPASPHRRLRDLGVDPQDPDRVFLAVGSPAGGAGSLLVSEDGGATFSSLPGPGLAAPLARLLARPDGTGAGAGTRLYGFTTTGRVFTRGEDDGGWRRLHDGLPAEARVTALDVSDRGDGEMVVGTEGDGVFRRTGTGAPFQPVGTDLPALPVEGLALVPGSGVVFAHLGAGGLWRHGVAETCDPAAGSLCLEGGRFRVDVDWRTRTGRSGAGRTGDLDPTLGADAWGWFWFFRRANAELAVKVLDGRPVNGHHWVFYASMTDVAFDLRVTDVAAGAFRVYRNPSGRLASFGDTAAFAAVESTPPAAAAGAEEIATPAPATAVVCGGGPGAVCLHGGRFRVEAEWWVEQGGAAGDATGEALSDDSGYLWFFRRPNPELFVKVLDGRPVNGHWWVFYGSLTDVGYRLTVTDTTSGDSRTYEKAPGTFASGADTTY